MKGKDRRGYRTGCEWVSLHLDAYLDGELNKSCADRVRAHLEECPACAAQELEARELKEMLLAVAACDDTVVPDASLRDSVMRSVHEQPRQESPLKAPNWRRVGAALATVCLLLAVLLIPPTLLRGASKEPANEGENHAGNNSSPQAPSLDSSENGGSWWEDIFGGLGDGANKDENPDLENTPNESPEAPGGNGYGDVNDAPGIVPGGSSGSGDNAQEGVTPARPIELHRVDGELQGDALWERLHGEWVGDTIELTIDIVNEEAYLVTEKGEYDATVTLKGSVLTLTLEDGRKLWFSVKLEGDVLWLTPVY